MTAKKILFPTDFSHTGDAALELATSLARDMDAKLLIVHVEEPPMAYGGGEMYYGMPEPAKDDLLRMLDGVTPNDPRVAFERRLVTGAPADAIVQLAESEHVDLVVMGTHGRSAASQIFLGKVAEEVVREAPCPVFSVKREDEGKSLGEMVRVLVPVDFSSTSTSAIDKAVEMSIPAATELHLLHVLEPPMMVASDFGAMPLVPVDEKAEALARLRETAAGIHARSPSLKPEIHVCEGAPAKEILSFARKQGVNLIVMGTHGLTGIVRLLFGSVAEKVVRRAHCPVFTVGLLQGRATHGNTASRRR